MTIERKNPLPQSVENNMSKHHLNNLAENYIKDVVEYYIESSLDNIISQLLGNPELITIVRDYNHESSIAWLCMARVELAQRDGDHPDKNNVGDMLSVIAGKHVDEKHWKTLEALVDYLYGPATWLLCRSDVKSNAHIPGYLWKLKLPLKGLGFDNGSGIDHFSGTELPGDAIG